MEMPPRMVPHLLLPIHPGWPEAAALREHRRSRRPQSRS